MGQIGVAVIGCGVWGVNHAKIYAGLDKAKLLKIADTDPERRRLTEKFDTECCADPRDIYRDEEVEAVSICTPTVTHARLAREALGAGKHVLVEKPMATKLSEAEELVRVSEKEGLVLAVGLVERFNPAVEETLRLVKDGSVGQLLTVHASRLSRCPGRVGDVGVVKDLAMHDVDVVTKVLGAQPVSVFSRCGSLSHSFEDYAHLSLIYDGAVLHGDSLEPLRGWVWIIGEHDTGAYEHVVADDGPRWQVDHALDAAVAAYPYAGVHMAE